MSKLSTCLLCLGSLAVGGVAGFFIGKKYGEDKILNCMNEDFDEYEDIPEEFRRQYIPEDDGVNPVGRGDDENSTMTIEDRNAIRAKLRYNHNQTVNYAAMYDKKEDPAESEHPVDSDEDDEDKEEAEVETYMANMEKEHNENAKANPSPKIISESALADLPSYIDEQQLYYYTEDDILADEGGSIVDDPAMLIGNALSKHHFDSNNDEQMYVVNYNLDVVYCVTKVFGAYTDM